MQKLKDIWKNLILRRKRVLCSWLSLLLWAQLPSFYVGDRFVRIIPFKDHINIEAKAILSHQESLTEYQLTPKGMLQIKHKQSVPIEVLKKIFQESFE